jgi:putative phosphoesterase
MTRIGLLSDTHGYIDGSVITHLRSCDEIWHAGDFGNIGIANELVEKTGLPLKGVFGNIDGYDIRSIYPEQLLFDCENVRVFMKHIGGYPNRYAPGVRQELINAKAKLFISGHSHILRIIYDDKLGCLHINPGAAGKQGWHKVRTLVRFTIDEKDIKDCQVVELGNR